MLDHVYNTGAVHRQAEYPFEHSKNLINLRPPNLGQRNVGRSICSLQDGIQPDVTGHRQALGLASSRP